MIAINQAVIRPQIYESLINKHIESINKFVIYINTLLGLMIETIVINGMVAEQSPPDHKLSGGFLLNYTITTSF